jgi:glycogen operon protein
MIVMGDEVRRTQRGNNNAYCQDNELSWFDWSLVSRHADLHRFVTLLNARRLLRDTAHERVSLNTLLRNANKSWHGVKLNEPDWSPYSHAVAFSADMPREKLTIFLILNAYWEPLTFELPPLSNSGGWRRWIDTSLDSPNDIVPWRKAPTIPGQSYQAGPRSVVLLSTGLGE